MALRVVILTDSSDRHYFFANTIVENFSSTVGVIVGGKTRNIPPPSLVDRLFKKKQLKRLRNKFLNVLFKVYGTKLSQLKAEAEEMYFKDQKSHFMANHASLILAKVEASDRSINDERFVDIIKQAKPDVIVVMGTCLIGRKIIDAAPHVINLHTGLSPYYRGGMSNFWPFLMGDTNAFGITVHRMSLGIDSGEIIHSARIEPETNDTYGTINCKGIMKGADLVIDALKLIESGNLNSLKQWESGLLFNNNDYNHFKAFQYFKVIKNLRYDAPPNKKIEIVENGQKHHV